MSSEEKNSHISNSINSSIVNTYLNFIPLFQNVPFICFLSHNQFCELSNNFGRFYHIHFEAFHAILQSQAGFQRLL